MTVGAMALAGVCVLVAFLFFAAASVLRPSWASHSTESRAHWTRISLYSCLSAVLVGLLGFVFSDVAVAGLVYASIAFLWTLNSLSDLAWHKVSTVVTFVFLAVMGLMILVSRTVSGADLASIVPVVFACLIGWSIISLVMNADAALWLAYVVSSYCVLVISHHPYVETVKSSIIHHGPAVAAGTAMTMSLCAVVVSLVLGSYIVCTTRSGPRTLREAAPSTRDDARQNRPYSLPYHIGMMKTAQAPSLAVGVLVVMLLS